MAEVNGMRIAVLKRTATAKVTGIVRGFQYQSEFTIPTQVEEKGMTFRVTEIDDAAFRNCSALTSITIPEGIVRIGKLAFAECSSLTSITIPKTVTQIESGRVDIGENVYYGHLFTNCPSLTSIVVEEGNPKYKTTQNGNGIIDKTTNTLIAGDQTTIIPEEVTSIGVYAFAKCKALTSITIPNSVTSIGNCAFYDCALTSITIPNSVTSIGNTAFNSCKNLTSITVANRNTVYDSRNNCNAIIQTSSNTLVVGCRSTIIPENVTNIGNCAFQDCRALTSVTIPDGVTSIGASAFSGCYALTSVTIPNSVTSIGEAAFMDCEAIISITIPNSVTSIGRYAFVNCKALTSITIPNSVTSIGAAAFMGSRFNSHLGACYYPTIMSLISVTIENEDGKVAIGASAFPDKAKITYVGKPKDRVEKIVRIMVEVPTLLALLDGKATEKEVQAICQQVKTLGEDAENLEKRLKKCIK